MKSIFASLIVALIAVSVSGKDRLCSFRAINSRPTTECPIDQRARDGRIYIASDRTKADIGSMKESWRPIGEKKTS